MRNFSKSLRALYISRNTHTLYKRSLPIYTPLLWLEAPLFLKIISVLIFISIIVFMILIVIEGVDFDRFDDEDE